MRTLLGLASLLLVLAAAVWVRTFRQPTEEKAAHPDANTGVLILGLSETPQDVNEARAPTASEQVGAAPLDMDMRTFTPPEPVEASFKPEPQPEPAPKPPASQPTRHQVGDGDTLWGIVNDHYGRAGEKLIQMVADANGMDDPSMLQPGMTLVLPSDPKD